jgi:L-threonine-O-3-phosphate decarboxylase
MKHNLLQHGGNLVWAARVAQCLPTEILDFSASINPLGCPASAIAAMQSSGAIHSISNYPDPNYINLRNAIAKYHNISPEWVLPGNGAAELLTWAGRDLADLVSVNLIVPAFSDYFRALRTAGAVIATVTQLQGKGGQDRGILINNPHNPTGKLYQRHDLISLLDDYKLVVIDEAFMDFLPPDQTQSLIADIEKYPNLVILRSLTKFFAIPGLRIGYAIAHPDRLKRWQGWRDPWSVNCLAERVAIACLADVEFQQKTLEWLPRSRSHLYAGLNQIPGLEPQMGAANFLLVKLTNPERSAIQLRDALLQHSRILIRDCQSFAELGDRYFRLCVKTSADHEQLFAAIHTIESG